MNHLVLHACMIGVAISRDVVKAYTSRLRPG